MSFICKHFQIKYTLQHLVSREWLNWQLKSAAAHYNDVIMSASQITSLTIVYSSVYSGADQRKHQSSASLALVREIHRWPVNSPHKWPVKRKMFPFDDVIMSKLCIVQTNSKENIKAPHYRPCGLPWQRVGNAERLSISWHHHGLMYVHRSFYVWAQPVRHNVTL